MSFSSWAETKVRKMDFWDIGLVKWSCVAFGVALAILFPVLREVNVWYWVALVVLLGVRPVYRVYRRK